MLSPLTFFSLFILAIITNSVASTGTVGQDPCKPRVTEKSKCYLDLYVNSQCKAAVIRFAGTDLTKSCDSVNMFWNYPINNLTLIIDTPYTANKQAYAIRLNTGGLSSTFFRIYQVQKNSICKALKSRKGVITAKCDQDYQVGLKFQGPKYISLFGVFIQYSVVRV